jgi:V8-like Glu-specific endopeptidase
MHAREGKFKTPYLCIYLQMAGKFDLIPQDRNFARGPRSMSGQRKCLVGFGAWLVLLASGLALSQTHSALAVVFGEDDRRIVDSQWYTVEDPPFSAIGKVIVTFPDGYKRSGTGTMVSYKHVLTSAHVVYSHDHCGESNSQNGCEASKIEFFPQLMGAVSSSKLYGKNAFDSTGLRPPLDIPTAYKNSQDAASDYALVALDRPVGAYTGWMDIQSYEEYLQQYSPSMLCNCGSAGYPDDLQNGRYMYYTNGKVDQVDQNFLWWDLEDEYSTWSFGGTLLSGGFDTYDGQSGSPVFTSYVGDEDRLVGIYRGSSPPPTVRNKAVKITPAIEAALANKMGAQVVPGHGIHGGSVTPGPSFADLLSMDAWAEGPIGSVSNAIPRVGESISLALDLVNRGTENSGQFSVAFYLTEGDSIASAIPLGVTQVSNIAPFSNLVSELTVSLSGSIAPGRYEVAWVIDSLNHVAEYDEDDNAGFFDTGLFVLNIDGSIPGDFNLDGSVDAADYVMWRKTNSGDAAAYATWRQHLGESAGAGGGSHSAGVPEPASGILLIFGCLVKWAVDRGSRSRGFSR